MQEHVRNSRLKQYQPRDRIESHVKDTLFCQRRLKNNVQVVCKTVYTGGGGSTIRVFRSNS